MITPEITQKIQLARTFNELRMNTCIDDPLQSRKLNRDLAIKSDNPWLVLATDAELAFAAKSGALPVKFAKPEVSTDNKILKLSDMGGIIGHGDNGSIQRLLTKPGQYWFSSGLEPDPIVDVGGVVPFVRDCLGVMAVSNGPYGTKLNGIHRAPNEQYGPKDIEELLDAHRGANTISIGIAGGENYDLSLLKRVGAQVDKIPSTKNQVKEMIGRVLGPTTIVDDIQLKFNTKKHLSYRTCLNHTLYGNTEGIRCNSSPIGF